jgi:hypothetical protein
MTPPIIKAAATSERESLSGFILISRNLTIALTIADEIAGPIIDRELAVALIGRSRYRNRANDRCARQSPAPNPMAMMLMTTAATKPANRAALSRTEIRTVTGP